MKLRDYAIVFRTKDDSTGFPGFRKVSTVQRISTVQSHYWELIPSRKEQRKEGYLLIQKAWSEGGWSLGIDELWFATEKLKLESDIDSLLTQGRDPLHVSMVCGMQRPSRISRFALSQCTHLFAFLSEGRDVLTLSEAFTPRLKQIIPRLEHYQFVYFNRITRELSVGYAQQAERLLG